MALETGLNRMLDKTASLPDNETFKRNKQLVRNEDPNHPDLTFQTRFTALIAIMEAINTKVAKGYRSIEK